MSSVMEIEKFSAWYGERRVLEEITLDVPAHRVLGIIGPAGAGKSTLLRSMNRMSALERHFRRAGRIHFRGVDIHDERVDVAVLRRKLGMVFAVPVPLPGTIYQNLAFGPRLDGRPRDMTALVESSLRAAYLWDEVKDRLHQSAFSLSGGQQQRLCLARTLMLEPEVLLLDEPTSGLDPISTAKIEEALSGLKKRTTVILVTNNVLQASRIADSTAFFLQGRLVEVGPTERIFVNPQEGLTHEYVRGHFG